LYWLLDSFRAAGENVAAGLEPVFDNPWLLELSVISKTEILETHGNPK